MDCVLAAAMCYVAATMCYGLAADMCYGLCCYGVAELICLNLGKILVCCCCYARSWASCCACLMLLLCSALWSVVFFAAGLLSVLWPCGLLFSLLGWYVAGFWMLPCYWGAPSRFSIAGESAWETYMMQFGFLAELSLLMFVLLLCYCCTVSGLIGYRGNVPGSNVFASALVGGFCPVRSAGRH